MSQTILFCIYTLTWFVFINKYIQYMYLFFLFLMKKYFKIIVLLVFVVSFLYWIWSSVSTRLTFTLNSLWVIIWTPDNLDIWSVNTWTFVNKYFSGYFWVKDLRWSNTGHYTTIQMNGLFGPNNSVITGIKLFANSPVLIEWQANNAQLNSIFNDWVDITDPVLFFYKNDNMNNWYLNKYWVIPSIRIWVPNDVSPWNYKWKITYTLYDYWVDIQN